MSDGFVRQSKRVLSLILYVWKLWIRQKQNYSTVHYVMVDYVMSTSIRRAINAI